VTVQVRVIRYEQRVGNPARGFQWKDVHRGVLVVSKKTHIGITAVARHVGRRHFQEVQHCGITLANRQDAPRVSVGGCASSVMSGMGESREVAITQRQSAPNVSLICHGIANALDRGSIRVQRIGGTNRFIAELPSASTPATHNDRPSHRGG